MRMLRMLACFTAVTAFAPIAAAQPAAPPPGAPPPAAPQTPREDDEEATRFRWGISGYGGKYFVNGTGGGIGGIDARFGAQINRMIGVYASPILMIGAGAAVSAGPGTASTNVSAVVLWGTGVLADFTFNDLFFVAIGPELLRGAAAQASQKVDSTSASQSASAETGTFFGIEARAGVALGSMKPNKRKAFTIGLDLHTIFTSKVTVVPVLALGYDMF